MEYNAPVMLAESRVTSMSHETTQLASLTALSIDLRPDFGPVRIPDFRELISKLQAEIPQSERTQRRVFSASDLETRNSQLETYSNRLSELLTPHASPLTDVDPIYTYDLNGNRVSMIDPTGLTTYTYDALNRLTSITNNRGFTTSFTYDALGRRTSMTHGNGVVTTYQYDPASQLTRLAHQLGAVTINSFDYLYDRVGNRKTKADRNGTASYTYDTLNRLIEAINPLPSNPLESFTYDAVGNRTNSNQNGVSVFNAANQLTEDANFTYQYDANGNLTRKTAKVGGDFTTYEYDAENKLVRVVTPGKTVNYRYDGLGRRVEKEIVDVATTVTRFIYDNEDILLELDGSNNIVARYTHGPGIDEPLVMEKGGVSFFYHADGLGSITEITDSTGVVKQQYTYSSFGKIESQLDPNFIQPYTFTAREFDPETGLYFYRARYYDATAGRFLQEDPLGLRGGINVYRYVNNQPTVLTDPQGKLAVPLIVPVIAIGAVYGAIENSVRAVSAGQSLPEIGQQALIGAGAGALGAAAGAFAVAATANPAVLGAIANAAFGAATSILQGQAPSVGQALVDAAVGAVAGQLTRQLIPPLRGRPPNLFAPRRLSDYGVKSLETLHQANLGGLLGTMGDMFADMLRGQSVCR